MPHNRGIDIPLNVLFKGLTGSSKGNLDSVSQEFAKVLKPFAKPLGIKIDTKSINTIKDLENLVSRLGASIQKTGKNFTVMLQNASGMEAIGNFVAGEVKSGKNQGKTYFQSQGSSYSSNRLRPTEQLNQDYKNLINATKELNRLEEKGLKGSNAWEKQKKSVEEYNNALRKTTEEYTKQFNLKTKQDNRLGKEVWSGDGALAKTQRNREFELQRIQSTHTSAMSKKSQDTIDANKTKEANQALRDYLTTSNELIRAKEKLTKMQTNGYYDKGVSQEELATQKNYVATLENKQQQLLKNATGAENYTHAVQQVQNAENTLETTTKKLIQQEAQRNLQRKQQQEEVNIVNRYVSALQNQYREEEKLVRLQQAKAPKAVIKAQEEVVQESRRQTQAVEQQAKSSKEYIKVKDKLVLAEKKHKQTLTELTTTTQKGVGIFGKFKQTLIQVVSAGLSWRIFSVITQTIKKTIDTVKELDESLVNLQIATNSSREQAEELLQSYNKMAKELGATTTEVASAADAWLRQGYSTEQTNELIRSSMVLSKIGQIESAEATEYLTSALKGFNIEATKSIEIVDKLAAIDLISATNASGLAEALSRTAASAQMAGVEMEQLLGYVAVVGEVTQKSMSSVGESFKTIFARFGQIKAGKFVDDETGENLNDVAKVLSKFNIELYDSQGNMADVGKILDKLSKKWKNLKTVEKNAIASAVAGTKQRENFIVLMDNYATAIKYTEEALNSSGTAMEKYDAFLQSIKASQDKLKATFEDFSQTLIDKGIIKGFYDLSSGALQFVTNILKLMPLLKGLLALLGGKGLAIIWLKLPSIFGKLKTSMIGLGTSFKQGIANIKLYIQSLSASKTAIVTTGQASQIAAGQMALAQIAATALIAVIMLGISAYKKRQQQIQENLDQAKEHIDTIKKEQESLESLRQEYIDLSNSENYNEETRESIKSVQEKINELVGDEAKNLDLVNGKLDEQLEKLDEINFKRAQQNFKVVAGEFATFEKNLGKQLFSFWETLIGGEGYYLNEYFSGNIERFKKYGHLAPSYFFSDQDLSLEETEKLLQEYTQFRDDIDPKINNEAWNEANNIVKELTQRINDYNKGLKVYNETQAQAVVGEYLFKHTIKTKEELQAYIDTLKQGEYSEEALAAMTDILIQKFPEFARELGLASEEVEEDFGNLTKSFEELKNAYEALSPAIEEYNEQGYVNFETMEKIIDLGGEYISLLVDENGNIRANTNILEESLRVKLREKALEQSLTYIKSFANKTDAEAIEIIQGKTLATLGAVDAELDLLATEVALLPVSLELKEAILSQTYAYMQMVETANFASSSTSDAEKATEKYEKVLAYVNKTIEDKIELLEQEREAIEKEIQEKIKAKEKEIELLEKEKEALEDKNEEKDKEIELQELQMKLQKAQQRTMRVYYADKGWVWEQNPEEVQKAQQELDDFYTEQEIDNIDKKIEALEDEVDALERTTDEEDELYDERLKRFDEQIDKLEEYKKKWNEVKENYEHKQNELIAQQMYGADVEEQILAGRVEILEDFKIGYTDALKETADKTETYCTTMNRSLESVLQKLKEVIEQLKVADIEDYYEQHGAKANIQKNSKGEYYLQTTFGTWVSMDNVTQKGEHYFIESGTKHYDKIPEHASGTKSALKGLANVDEKGKELIIPKQGRYRMMEYGDIVVPHNLSQRLFEMATNPTKFISTAFANSTVPNLSTISNVESTTISINKIELPSVTNGENFIKQLKLLTANR